MSAWISLYIMIPHISTLHYMSCSYMVLQHAASIVCCSFFLVKWWAIEWTWWQLEENQRSEIHMQLRVTPTASFMTAEAFACVMKRCQACFSPKMMASLRERFEDAARCAARIAGVKSIVSASNASMSYVKHIEALIKSDQNIKTKHCHGKALPAKALQRSVCSDDQFSDETFPDSCQIFPEIVPTESFNSCKVDGCDDCDSYGNKKSKRTCTCRSLLLFRNKSGR